jgi:hypothetical protein
MKALEGHGIRCRLLGHSPKSPCIPLLDRAVIAVGEANLAGRGATAEEIARALGVTREVAHPLLAELVERRLISPLAYMSDVELVDAIHRETRK